MPSTYERGGRQVTWYSITETAGLLRAALAAAFPGVRFSVRSDKYAGGGSIRVRWTEGPERHEVHPVADRFAGATFDGMTDSKHYREGVGPDGQPASYGADFVFLTRETAEEEASRREWELADQKRRELRRQRRAGRPS